MRKLLLLPAAALVLAAPALAGLTSSPDVTELVKQALVKLHANPQFKKAVLLEADGTPKAGTKVKTAVGITKWRLVFQNQTTKGSKYASAFIRVTNGKLGPIVGVKEPFLEDRNMTVPKMTLAVAVKKLQAAGHTAPFGAVTLRYPLGPGFHEPLYIFGFGSGQYWSVGTKTGKVKPIS